MQQSRETENKEHSKQKLTLGIDKDIIEKAKAAGINISGITEQLFKTMTYRSDDGSTRDDVVRAYKILIEKAWSLMAKYSQEGFDIDVGEEGANKIRINGYGGLTLWDDDHYSVIGDPVSVDEVLECLYNPMKILENLIIELAKVAEYNKQKIIELKFVSRLIKALSDEDEGEKQK